VNNLSQDKLLKLIPSQTLLKFNIPNIDKLFPGFTLGDFAVLYGMSTVLPLSLLLTVRAQLPFQLGGLETNTIFVDGGNTFRLYEVSRIAQLHHLNPQQVLQRIYISRAFTAYQMTSIILQKLKETVQKFNPKLVIISDIAGLFLDKDIPTREAKEIFNRLTIHLSEFAKENQIVIIATHLFHRNSKRAVYFHAAICGRANTVIAIKPSKFGQQFVLEKHPMFSLVRAELSSENLTLSQFMEAYE
jgi:hypothetical protein